MTTGGDITRGGVPDFLRAMFADDALAGALSTLVALSATGTILWVNVAWREFAAANGGEDVLRRFGPGLSYFDGISRPLRSFYEGAFENARLTGRPFEHDYECSSPEQYRLHHLRALPFGSEGLLLEHSLVVERPLGRVSADPVDACYRNEHGMILQCSNCRRVRRAEANAWDWVRPWVESPPLDLSHGICGACMGYYWEPRLRRRKGPASTGEGSAP